MVGIILKDIFFRALKFTFLKIINVIFRETFLAWQLSFKL